MRGYRRGQAVVWDEDGQVWRYADTGAPFDDARPCPQCQRMPHPDGRDACFADPIAGASGACCGHGVHVGYVNWLTIAAPDDWWRGTFITGGGER